MFKTIKSAMSVPEIRKRLLFVLLCVIIMRIGAQIPTPGINPEFFQEYFSSGGNFMGFMDMFTGGSFSSMSILALSITPYITASIVMQLLTFSIPALEEMQKEGETGREKITKITRYLAIGLAAFESTAMAIGFGRQGLIVDANALKTIVVIVSLTAGAAFLIWLGDKITERGIGIGTSIILLVNIVSRLPSDIVTLFEQFVMTDKAIGQRAVAAIVIVAVILLTIMLVVVLEGGRRNVPVQYSGKVVGRRLVGGKGSQMPIKVNTAGVIPIIFASSIMSFPALIMTIIGKQTTTGAGAFITTALSQSNWFDPARIRYTAGYAVYVVLVILFAYFYTSFTFNPREVADNLKKQGGLIPGVRPGKPTELYMKRMLNCLVFFGAVGLIIIATIPLVFNGIFNANVSFGGTSLIIIVGVIVETTKQLESMMAVRNYKGFLINVK